MFDVSLDHYRWNVRSLKIRECLWNDFLSIAAHMEHLGLELSRPEVFTCRTNCRTLTTTYCMECSFSDPCALHLSSYPCDHDVQLKVEISSDTTRWAVVCLNSDDTKNIADTER